MQTPVDLACARSSASRLFTRDGGKKKRCEGTRGERSRPWKKRGGKVATTENGIFEVVMKKRDGEGCGGAHAANQLPPPLYSCSSSSSTFHYLPSGEDTYCCQSVHSQRERGLMNERNWNRFCLRGLFLNFV